jgi:hypothetical protein
MDYLLWQFVSPSPNEYPSWWMRSEPREGRRLRLFQSRSLLAVAGLGTFHEHGLAVTRLPRGIGAPVYSLSKETTSS